MDLGEQYDCVASLILDLKSAAESARRLGMQNLAGELGNAVDFFRGELAMLDEKIEEESRTESEYMNRAYERSVI